MDVHNPQVRSFNMSQINNAIDQNDPEGRLSVTTAQTPVRAPGLLLLLPLAGGLALELPRRLDAAGRRPSLRRLRGVAGVHLAVRRAAAAVALRSSHYVLI